MGFLGTGDPSIEAHEAISRPWAAGGGRGGEIGVGAAEKNQTLSRTYLRT